MLAPVLSQIADENEDIVVGRVNVDEEMELAREFGIQSIPTVILFEDGRPVQQNIGLASERMSRGITLTEEQGDKLVKALGQRMLDKQKARAERDPYER